MMVLFLSLGAALILVMALIFFFRSSAANELLGTPPANSGIQQSRASSLASAAINEAIFSQRDWDFILREGCPALEKLFLSERKAVASYWLTVTHTRISSIRRTHVQNSRFSRDLSPGKELQFLLRFLYLSAACRLGLLLIHIAGPVAPASFAAHIQHLADTLLAVSESSFSAAPEN